MPANLLETLFSAYRRKLLGFILLRPGESFHVRELERLTGVPAGSLHRELKLLTDAGLLTRHPVGNQVRYQANETCPIYDELAGVFRKAPAITGKREKEKVTGSDRPIAAPRGTTEEIMSWVRGE